MDLKILSANIAFGLPRMDKLIPNLKAHLGIHGWQLIPLFIAGNATHFLFDLTQSRYPEKTTYVREKSDLSRVLHVIDTKAPDIAVINELLFRVHKHEIELWLRDAGYQYFSWGKSAYHSSQYDHRDMTMATLVASKLPVEEGYVPFMPQLAAPGGGGGIAGVRLKDNPITVIGVHLSVYYRKMWKSQVERLAELVQNERDAGRQVIIAGDWNATQKPIRKIRDFSSLGLVSADPKRRPTCPTNQVFGFPRSRQIDHMYIPGSMKTTDFETGHFGSDHKWICGTFSI